MATVFMESGTDATQGFQFYFSTSGTVESDSAKSNTGPRSIKMTSDAGSGSGSVLRKHSSVLSDSGTRVSFYVNFTHLPAQDAGSAANFVNFQTTSNTQIFALRMDSSGGLSLSINTTGGTIDADTGSTLSTGTWYRLCVAYTITSSTVNEFRVYLDGSLDMTASDQSLTITGTSRLWFFSPAGTLSGVNNYDDIYVDDSSSLNDTGDIHVTAKLPSANNTNNFDTNIGNNPSNRYENVNERALSETNGWQHTGNDVASENYTIQNAATGDVDISSATLVAHFGWIWARRGGEEDTPTFVGSATNNSKSTGTSLSVTVPAGGWAAGTSVIVVFACDDASGTFSVSDSSSNTYSEDASQTRAGDSRVYIFSTHNITALDAGDTVDISHPSLTARAAVVANFSGLETSPVDVTNTATGGTNNMNISTVTASENDELQIAGFGVEGPNSETHTDDTTSETETKVAQDGTTGAGAASNITASMFYEVNTFDTGLSSDVDNSASRDWAGALVGYKRNKGVGSPKITVNGSDSSITLATSSSLYSVITDSASYPSNSAAIGIKSGGDAADAYLYECGILIAYIPPGPATILQDIIQQGIIPFPR